MISGFMSLEAGQVVWCTDYQYLANAGKHQHGDRIIYHRFVENRNQLLTDTFGDGNKTVPEKESTDYYMPSLFGPEDF